MFWFLVGKGFHGLFESVNDGVLFRGGLFVLDLLGYLLIFCNRKDIIRLAQNIILLLLKGLHFELKIRYIGHDKLSINYACKDKS